MMNARLVVLAAAVAAAAAALFVSLDDSRGGDVRTLEIGERDVELIAVDGGAAGPESVAFDAAGEGPYTGVSDGRVLKWLPLQRRWVEHSSASNEPQRVTVVCSFLSFSNSPTHLWQILD
ncbi:protein STRICTOSIDINE SYNTHASE-LIKE 10-like [Oryza brachyantha]|uniref:protein STRICTOSIDINE SYNTHASE-LIKE 10-like n=1 Tax=Oryza brachyantha TaxID=4533 RepID=UPI001ADAB80B|nr:protein STRICTOSIDINE SYNTHASE-LIKE 10-like [Oryza brachyantha]